MFLVILLHLNFLLPGVSLRNFMVGEDIFMVGDI